MIFENAVRDRLVETTTVARSSVPPPLTPAVPENSIRQIRSADLARPLSGLGKPAYFTPGARRYVLPPSSLKSALVLALNPGARVSSSRDGAAALAHNCSELNSSLVVPAEIASLPTPSNLASLFSAATYGGIYCVTNPRPTPRARRIR